MIREAMQFANLALWPNLGLLCFVAVFLGAIVWVFRSGSSEQYREIANIPLHTEE